MDSVALKSRLHEYIEQADSDLLLAIYVLLGKSVASDKKYDEPTLAMLYKRIEADERGVSVSYSKEDVLGFIRSQNPNK